MARQLVRSGWDVRVITSQEHSTDAEIDQFNRDQPYVVAHRVRGTRLLAWVADAVRAAVRINWQWRPDVVLAGGVNAIYAAALAGPLLRRPWVAIAYGTELVTPERQNLTRLAFRLATAVVPISEYTKGLLDAAGVEPRNVTVIPPGADNGLFRPGLDVDAVRRSLGVTGPVLLTVGAVKERKGQSVVIRSLPYIREQFPGLVYLIVGRPEPAGDLSALVEGLGLQDAVRFLGLVPQEQLPGLMTLADVFVMVSRQTETGDTEGYGIAVLEAAMCGRPAVVSRGCGVEETVSDGRTGLVVDQNDPVGTARAIGRLLGDAPLREQMGKAASEAAHGDATWEKRARRFDLLLRSLVEGAPGGPPKTRSETV